MKTIARSIVFATVSLILSLAAPCFGQRNGGVIVRVPGASPECINGKTDRVWLTLYRVILTKDHGWFTSSNQAEIIAKVTAITDPQAAQTLSFPLSTKVNMRDYANGQVFLPVEYPLVSGFSLKQNNVMYTSFGLDTTLVNVRGRNKLGGALTALADITGSNKLPIPDSPYTQAAGYLLSFASKAVQADIDNQNADDKYTTSQLSLSFDPDGACNSSGPDGNGFETTGTKAIVMGDGARGDGYVPIDHVNDYCWTAELTPAFVLKAAGKVAGIPCSDPSYASKYKSVTNNYVAFFLQKRTVSGRLGGPDDVQKDINASQKLCDLLGVTDCPAAKQQ